MATKFRNHVDRGGLQEACRRSQVRALDGRGTAERAQHLGIHLLIVDNQERIEAKLDRVLELLEGRGDGN